MTSRPAIAVSGLDFTYPGGETALNDLSFEVPAGVVFGFLGLNGAGKTTTLHVLLGMLAPPDGSIRVLGLDPRVDGESVRARCGALLEHHGLYEHLSADDNLRFYGRAYGLTSDQVDARVAELLSGLGLWSRRTERVGSWSKGMKHRLGIARAMVAGPALLFLDEPTSGLDVAASLEVRSAISALAHEDGATVFLTTHNMSEAEALCDEIVVVRGGHAVFAGTPEQARLAARAEHLEEAFLALQEVSNA